MNSWGDIDEGKLIDIRSISPMGNHYLVRATSMKTGHTFIVDGYLGPGVSTETSLEKKRIIMNAYEECWFNIVMQVKLRVSVTDFSGALASFTPIIKTKIARAAKSAAGTCVSGAVTVRVSGGVL